MAEFLAENLIIASPKPLLSVPLEHIPLAMSATVSMYGPQRRAVHVGLGSGSERPHSG